MGGLWGSFIFCFGSSPFLIFGFNLLICSSSFVDFGFNLPFFRVGIRYFCKRFEFRCVRAAKNSKSSEKTCFFILVQEMGVEPTRPRGHWHLKPARLPASQTSLLPFCLSAKACIFARLLLCPKMTSIFGGPFLRNGIHALVFILVQEMGVEPTRPRGHWHLKPARLPFRHSCSLVFICVWKTLKIISKTTAFVNKKPAQLSGLCFFKN